jgi:uncharacterized protein (TIGR03086 family)
VTTEVFEGFPDAIAVNTLTLAEHDGVTTLTVIVHHTCKLHRDGHVDSGMEGGLQQALDRVERIAAGDDATEDDPVTEVAERFATVAAGFTRCVEAVAPLAWQNASPCEGWTAADIVSHVTTWIPSFFNGVAGLALPVGPSVDGNPVAAWTALRDALGAVLADPTESSREFDGPPGRMSIEQSIDMIVTGDLLIHTWDLARATGLDETLDAEQVHRMFAGVEPYDEMLRSSGQYGPRVMVADDADEQTKLIAFMGRNPSHTAGR